MLTPSLGAVTPAFDGVTFMGVDDRRSTGPWSRSPYASPSAFSTWRIELAVLSTISVSSASVTL